MQKEKRKQSKHEADDSSSRKRRKADLSKPVSFISTAGRIEEITETETIIEGATINSEEENESSRNRGSPTQGHTLAKRFVTLLGVHSIMDW
ncbi:hypothetical protein SADUNF_Sadunf19G0019900 [Salix dunnii]|uniref:Uncharacterized protein n=1 Tax=Salix dunnii TaxID=1413687 RepID=A0A835IXX9_9ROSI|nr:hypothetical protein SADUNF_Sadunf19G0019900 [Salix dunnii]